MQVFNLTQHEPTAKQIEAGLMPRDDRDEAEVKKLITFDWLEEVTPSEMRRRAMCCAMIAQASGAKYAMCGGVAYFVRYLENALIELGIKPIYSFSERRSVEVEVDGVVEKKSVFVYVGFVEAFQ
jgi:hypothetical protein